MRTNQRPYLTLTLTVLFLLGGLQVLVPRVEGAAEHRAEQITGSFQNLSEITQLTWRNVQNAAIGTYFELSQAEHEVYRSNMSIANNSFAAGVPAGVELVVNMPACGGAAISDCEDVVHSFNVVIPPDTQRTSYYCVVTRKTLDGSLLNDDCLHNASQIGPINETSRAEITPIWLKASYSNSQTQLNWISYAELPGVPDASGNSTHLELWRHPVAADRGTWYDNDMVKERIRVIEWENNSAMVTVPDQTQRQSYYSIIPVIDGWADTRFTRNYTLATPVREDNVPPGPILNVIAEFTSTGSGSGHTQITWDDLETESGERYTVWRSSKTITQVNTAEEKSDYISEHTDSLNWDIPRGSRGTYHYAVTATDKDGNLDTTVVNASRSDAVTEDTLDAWVSEPTDVTAEYLGNGQTLVKWLDQIGAMGELYRIYWKNGSGASSAAGVFVMNANEGAGQVGVIINIPGGVSRTSWYCVTSVVPFGSLGEVHEDTRFKQNCITNRINEVTKPPSEAKVTSVRIDVRDQLDGTSEPHLVLRWMSGSNTMQETYNVYRTLTDPCASSMVTNLGDASAGWQLVRADIEPSNDARALLDMELETGLQRTAWYGILTRDEHLNLGTRFVCDTNVIEHEEDTTPPSGMVWMGQPGQTSFIAGTHRIHVRPDEVLYEEEGPQITVFDSEQNELVSGTAAPAVDPLAPGNQSWTLNLMIPDDTATGLLHAEVKLRDVKRNLGVVTVDSWWVDTSSPTLDIYAPGNNTYQKGETLRIYGGSTDDVAILRIQLQFNDDSSWIDVFEADPDGEQVRATDFDYGIATSTWPAQAHRVRVRVLDAAGNQHEEELRFLVDSCRQDADTGATVCELDSVTPPREKEERTVNWTDPAMTIAYGALAFDVVLLLVAMLAISTALKTPNVTKKKRGEEDEVETEDWMMEFLGGSNQAQEHTPDSDTVGRPRHIDVSEQKPLGADDDKVTYGVVEKRDTRRRHDVDDRDDDRPRREGRTMPRGRGISDDSDRSNRPHRRTGGDDSSAAGRRRPSDEDEDRDQPKRRLARRD